MKRLVRLAIECPRSSRSMYLERVHTVHPEVWPILSTGVPGTQLLLSKASITK